MAIHKFEIKLDEDWNTQPHKDRGGLNYEQLKFEEKWWGIDLDKNYIGSIYHLSKEQLELYKKLAKKITKDE